MTAPARAARVEIDLGAIIANYRTFQGLAPGAEVAAVLKADAYGLGAGQVAPALAKAGARSFFAATLGEALRVRAVLGPGPRIYVLNGPTPQDAAHYGDVTPVLNSMAQIAAWAGRGEAALHFDTGMNRLGLDVSDAAAAHAACPAPILVLSHLACASWPAHSANRLQKERFEAAAAHFPFARKSLSATAGAQLGAAFHFDMVRIGMGLYGAADRENGVALQNVARVTAPILAVRTAPAGESIGYGASLVAQSPMRLATVGVGYADGFLRSLAGRGYGVVGGVKRPIVGRVSMDLIILDVTGDDDVRPGDEAELLGPAAPLAEVAACASTNTYEILTSFVGAVRRAQGGGA